MKSSSLALIVTSLFVSGLVADDWPQFQGPDRIGISPAEGLNLTGWDSNPPEILWEKELNNGFGGASISGEEVFIVDRDIGERDRLLCLSLEDGATKWEFSYDYQGKLSFPGSRGVPLVEEDAVYYISGFGQVFRINRETHEPDWMVSMREEYGAEDGTPKWGWAQSPVVVGDILIVPAHSDSAGLVGIDKNSGEIQWETEGFGNSHSTPTVMTLQGVEQVVFIATQRDDNDSGVGTTISLLPESGEVLWKTDVYFNKIPIPFPSKVTEELVFLTGGYENGSCMIKVKKNEGKEWDIEKVFDMTQGTQIHPPFVIDEYIYFLANENANHKGEARTTGGLMCMDFEGNIQWQTGDQPFMGRGNMILVEGHLLIQDGEVGYLRVVEPSPEGYQEVAFFDVFDKKEEVDEQIAKQANRAVKRMPDFQFWSPMALADGHLIVRGQNMVKCLNLN
ncbi:MAG: PQQ-binding-like beta-propeller repeat protein [Verrucomicrobiota bacterium]